MQLVLPVLHSHDYRFHNFQTGNNGALLAHVQKTIKGNCTPGPAITFCYGATGSGKTHLLSASHYMAESLGLSCQYIDMRELLSMPPQIIDGIGNMSAVFIDNIHVIANDRAWQLQLFDTLNQFLEKASCCMMIASRQSVKACEFSLPDLASRLTWGTTYRLNELSEDDKVQALKEHFDHRGIHVQDEVIEFLMKRSERDMHKLMALVEQLDRLSLQSKRKLTIPFVKQALTL